MKRVAFCLSLLILLAGIILAGSGIDGKWTSERKMERDGQSFTVVQTFDFKAEGPKLTGKMTMQFGDMEPRTMDIQDGKISGDKATWSSVFQGPNGDMKINYSATLNGDTLKGESVREGGDPRPFEAKRK